MLNFCPSLQTTCSYKILCSPVLLAKAVPPDIDICSYYLVSLMKDRDNVIIWTFAAAFDETTSHS